MKRHNGFDRAYVRTAALRVSTGKRTTQAGRQLADAARGDRREIPRRACMRGRGGARRLAMPALALLVLARSPCRLAVSDPNHRVRGDRAPDC